VKEVWRVALLYLALTIALAYPLSIHPGSAVLSPTPDTNLFLWTLQWDVHALTHQPLTIFDANIYAPERNTLAYSENLLGSAPFAAPILWLTGNAVLAMNLVVLLASVLCGVGTYLLARRLGVGPLGATLSGLVFAFSPPRFLRLDQVHLATIQWVPFGLASLHAYWDTGRTRDIRLAAGFFALQALTSGHGAVFLLVAMAVMIAWRLASGASRLSLNWLKDLDVAGAFLLAPAVLVMLPYREVQQDMGLRRTLEDWAVPWACFLASATHVHAALLALVPSWHINDAVGPTLFPGIIPIVLGGVALAARSRAKYPYAILALLGFLLAAGPPLGLWPLVYWLPGLNFIRAPSRFMLMAILGLAVLSGIGFDHVAARLAPRRRLWLAVAAGALLVIECSAAPLTIEPYRPEPPAIDRWLASRPGSMVIAEVPVGDPHSYAGWEARESTFMLHSTAHWQRTVHGYSGFRSQLHQTLYERMATFPDERSLQSLADVGVTEVVVHTDLYEPAEWIEVEARIARAGAWLSLEHEEGAGRVYALRGPR